MGSTTPLLPQNDHINAFNICPGRGAVRQLANIHRFKLSKVCEEVGERAELSAFRCLSQAPLLHKTSDCTKRPGCNPSPLCNFPLI
mmetsp:Transcript_34929/g.79638  ORF Transcript_34929/g.79638 Transcript_34929/m.79638 type:complete len:86 (-) Transcript_34929:632-889(-)